MTRMDADGYRDDETIAVIEIVSPGNKASQLALRQFVEKSLELLERGIHLLVVDLFPPIRRDPEGIHPAIWSGINGEPFALPADKRLTLAAYVAGTFKTAYVEPVAAADSLPAMPLFLDSKKYIKDSRPLGALRSGSATDIWPILQVQGA